MIKKLRTRFILIAMGSITAVLAIIIGAINIAGYTRVNESADHILGVLIENGGAFPKPDNRGEGAPRILPPETPYETRYFMAVLNDEGQIIQSNVRSIAAITHTEAEEYAQAVWESGKTSGYKDVYRFATVKTDGETLVVFLDRTRELASVQSFLFISLLVSIVGIASVFVLVLVFSKIALKPVAESYEKQKRFITDASHEIKTPLTIIDANTDVLELVGTENEWTQSIKKQVRRLSSLTENLLSLSRLDEDNNALTMVDFSFSDAVNESIEPFLTLAEKNGKHFLLDVQNHITQTGNEALLRQLISILADNAIRYGAENASIKVSLKKQGRHNVLTFSNPVESIPVGNLDVLFERFYRADSSRSSQTGGYGIGLSIAQSIVLAHKGKIHAESTDGASIVFTVLL